MGAAMSSIASFVGVNVLDTVVRPFFSSVWDLLVGGVDRAICYRGEDRALKEAYFGPTVAPRALPGPDDWRPTYAGRVPPGYMVVYEGNPGYEKPFMVPIHKWAERQQQMQMGSYQNANQNGNQNDNQNGNQNGSSNGFGSNDFNPNAGNSMHDVDGAAPFKNNFDITATEAKPDNKQNCNEKGQNSNAAVDQNFSMAEIFKEFLKNQKPEGPEWSGGDFGGNKGKKKGGPNNGGAKGDREIIYHKANRNVETSDGEDSGNNGSNNRGNGSNQWGNGRGGGKNKNNGCNHGNCNHGREPVQANGYLINVVYTQSPGQQLMPVSPTYGHVHMAPTIAPPAQVIQPVYTAPAMAPPMAYPSNYATAPIHAHAAGMLPVNMMPVYNQAPTAYPPINVYMGYR